MNGRKEEDEEEEEEAKRKKKQTFSVIDWNFAFFEKKSEYFSMRTL
jgi:hypothetical protein